ncbi:MAG TPA: radical SAM family heme chaperone HemW [Bryobacteraceae bacterium]|nr:radical SAM family heme chaperone HemW [Bryobacteraceae bacterium]
MAGVYLSYPFCAQKCTFCNFASGVASDDVQRHYERMLLREIEHHDWKWLPETIYWGGGTPSLMPLDEFADAMRAIPAAHIKEATLECAPGSVTADRAQAWRAAGINRVSLGVQSFVEAETRRTGRKHSAEIVERELNMLANAGISNINIDLIAGLPGQTLESWQTSLDWVERLAPPHVSVYMFEIDEDSRLGREALLGKIRYGANALPPDDTVAEFYECAVERLKSAGLPRYEISNFARPDFESLHNLKYWTLEPYIGFGVDAHSFDGSLRWSNIDSAEEYIARLENHLNPGAGESLSDCEEEHFFVGLRLAAGIEPTEHEWSRFKDPIERSLASGLLVQDAKRLRLTNRGFLLSNEVFQEFVYAPAI